MAFDQAVEADKVNDFGLLSAIVHAPLWIIGNVLGNKPETAKADNVAYLQHEVDNTSSLNFQPTTQKNPGNVDSSKDIIFQDGRVSCQVGREPATSSSNTRSPRSSMDAIGLGSDKGNVHSLRRTKKMSWSDESGQSLVEYADESTRQDQSPSSVGPTVKPVRSAMRRSNRSSGGGNLENFQERTRYIPKMGKADNGLRMPTRPYGSDPVVNGVESPQWGWYTNITPPTPEMYYGQTSCGKPKATDSSSEPAGSSTDSKSQHNQVFQNLQATKGPIGWTSVPI